MHIRGWELGLGWSWFKRREPCHRWPTKSRWQVAGGRCSEGHRRTPGLPSDGGDDSDGLAPGAPQLPAHPPDVGGRGTSRWGGGFLEGVWGGGNTTAN